ncbi:hypothetical protein [Methylorubrum populi]|uniref:Uncharacterized protein n=1 Tax=Methylorubrum populi TaxID=223967 RepID=A0A833N5B7_9HYPH|nr:hypothetical protein [Methylorubrum populi]KAB7788085.1 hypothetical protein F8B43_0090 [Methylorubrum populi]
MAFRPEPGRYVTRHGEGCYVIVRKEATPAEDGAVSVLFDNGSYTGAFFRTFERWGYRRVEDEPSPSPLAAEGKSEGEP